MSKIVPKSIQSQSSQNIKSNQDRNENVENDLMFASLLGDASGKTSSEELLIGKASMATIKSVDSSDENSFCEQTSDDLVALMVSFHGGRGLGQKNNGPHFEQRAGVQSRRKAHDRPLGARLDLYEMCGAYGEEHCKINTSTAPLSSARQFAAGCT